MRYAKRKCKGCGKVRSTQGDYCMACIDKRLASKKNHPSSNMGWW